MEFIIGIVAIILAWLFFSNVIRAKTPFRQKTKAVIVVLLFSTLIIGFSRDIYAVISRTFFSINKDGEVTLSASPFRIPDNEKKSYCHQFTDQNNRPIQIVSIRGNERYCGQFWRFNKMQLSLPYRNIDATHSMYWASPSLQMMGPKPKVKTQ